jgi:hypothetical protein
MAAAAGRFANRPYEPKCADTTDVRVVAERGEQFDVANRISREEGNGIRNAYGICADTCTSHASSVKRIP